MSHSRAVGGLLMAVAFIVLLAGAGKPFSAWNFLGFLACFVAGVMLVLGAARLPRRILRSSARTIPPPPPDALTLVCRPPSSAVGLWLATAIASSLVILGVFLLVQAPRLFRATPAELVALTGVPLAAGVGLLVYLRRHRRVQFVIAPDRLHARGYWHVVDVAWSDVQALSFRDAWTVGPPATIYTVHTATRAVSFFSTWPDAGVMAEQIARRTGLTWTD